MERMMIDEAFSGHLDAQKKLSFIFLYSVGLLKVFFAFLYEKEEDLFNHSDHIICLTSKEIKFDICLLQKK